MGFFLLIYCLKNPSPQKQTSSTNMNDQTENFPTMKDESILEELCSRRMEVDAAEDHKSNF